MEIVDSIKRVAKANNIQLSEIAKQMGLAYSSFWSRLRDPKLSTLQAVARNTGRIIRESNLNVYVFVTTSFSFTE